MFSDIYTPSKQSREFVIGYYNTNNYLYLIDSVTSLDIDSIGLSLMFPLIVNLFAKNIRMNFTVDV